jgi:hypothetical protein
MEPFVEIRVKPRTEHGSFFLSGECLTFEEIEIAVASLKSQLDDVLKEARQKFADEHRDRDIGETRRREPWQD